MKLKVLKAIVLGGKDRKAGEVVSVDGKVVSEKTAKILTREGKVEPFMELNSPSGDKKQGKKGGGNDKPPAPPADDNSGESGGEGNPPV